MKHLHSIYTSDSSKLAGYIHTIVVFSFLIKYILIKQRANCFHARQIRRRKQLPAFFIFLLRRLFYEKSYFENKRNVACCWISIDCNAIWM